MHLPPRNILMILGAVWLTLSTVPLLGGCRGLVRGDLGQVPDSIPGLGPDEQDILRLASLAPSGHNTQPWRVRIVEPHVWIILSDEQRWLPAVDPQQRETLLSIGAFVENLVLAAEGHGYRVDVDILAKSAQDKEVARIKLSPADSSGDLKTIAEHIEQRRVVRSGYRTRAISAPDLHYIADGDLTRITYYPPNSKQDRYLREGTLAANRQQASHTAAQAELADWIRWSNSEAQANRDGLTPAGMEITGFAGWYVRHFFSRKDVLAEGFKVQSIAKVKEQVRQHGGWLVLTSKDSTVEQLLETGRRFQQIFLRVKDKNIAVHPMTQMLEEAPWSDHIAEELGLSGQVQFILRVGYLKHYPDPVTLRRPPSQFSLK